MPHAENHHDDIPRFEPWLGVMMTSVVPVAASMYLPRFLVPLLALGAALFAAGLVMLRLQSSRRRKSMA